MHDHTHESVPTRVRAVQITADPESTQAAMNEVFRYPAELRARWRTAAHVDVVVHVPSPDGSVAWEHTGAWIVEDPDNPVVFHVVNADVFAARYRGL